MEQMSKLTIFTTEVALNIILCNFAAVSMGVGMIWDMARRRTAAHGDQPLLEAELEFIMTEINIYVIGSDIFENDISNPLIC